MGAFLLTFIPAVLYFYYGRGYLNLETKEGTPQRKLATVLISVLAIIALIMGPVGSAFGLAGFLLFTMKEIKEVLNSAWSTFKEDFRKLRALPFIDNKITRIKEFFGFKKKVKKTWRNNSSEHKEGLVEQEKVLEELKKDRW